MRKPIVEFAPGKAVTLRGETATVVSLVQSGAEGESPGIEGLRLKCAAVLELDGRLHGHLGPGADRRPDAARRGEIIRIDTGGAPSGPAASSASADLAVLADFDPVEGPPARTTSDHPSPAGQGAGVDLPGERALRDEAQG